jgi:hypothetical protein
MQLKNNPIMNKNYIFTLLFIFSLTATQAQNYYSLKPSVSTYSDLVNPVVLSSDTLAQGYYFIDSTVFPMYGHYLDFNTGTYIDKDGFIAIPEIAPSNFLDILDIAYGSYRRRDSSSSISVNYEGPQGKGILKVQWKNMGINGYINSNYVNFQVWFNQSDNSISFHYGPGKLTKALDPVIGLMRAPDDSDTLSHATLLQGTASDPSGLKVFYSRKLPVYPVNGFPPDGTVYTFNKNTSGIGRNKLSALSVYPIPAKDKLYIGNMAPSDIKILDISGRQLLHLPTATEIDIKELAPGMYMLMINDAFHTKFLKG